jgi:hypothetical protein
VVPALIAQDSLLEVKVLLPTLSQTWAKSAHSILKIASSGVEAAPAAAPVIETPLVLTPEISSPDTLLSVLRESLKQHGARGIIGLGRKFRIVDDNNSGTIDLSEFTKMIAEHSFAWTAPQIKALFDSFDNDKSGSISYDEFLQTLRGELNERRTQLVLLAFEVMNFVL